MKGYKVFNEDWTCRDFQYEVGETYELDGELEICVNGFHFCEKVADCFEYYSFNPKNKIAEVEAIGNTETEGDKTATDKIKILREVTWEEMLTLANSGHSNSGNRNSGDSNSGYSNSGDWNSGDSNSGYRNSGNWNSGDWNSGDWNSGDWNSGYWNSGDWNSGYWNSGYWNSGYWNSGDWNSGNWNSGNRNSGNWNSGNRNSGDWNSGNWNSGDWNSGNWNSGDGNNGFFNTEEHTVKIFDKDSEFTQREARNISGIRVLNNFYYHPTKWISEYNMSEEEKEKHPEYETLGGYLKNNPQDRKEAFAEFWVNLNKTEKDYVLAIPNFDTEKFEEITGVNVIELEPRFYVLNNKNTLLLYKDTNGEICEGYYNLSWITKNHKVTYQLTEQEIKDFDPNYWAFAKPVEEVDL